MSGLKPEDIIRRYQRAQERRASWEGIWQDCYDFALPSRDTAVRLSSSGRGTGSDRLFDGTAPDAVDQLASSLMAHLTPPWGEWFGFAVGPDVPSDDRWPLSQELERATSVLQSHFNRSNFAVEMHQCYLDLVTAGTASLLFEEAAPGEVSAFRFSAVPLSQIILEEGPSGRLDTTFRRSEFTHAQLIKRFPSYVGMGESAKTLREGQEAKAPVIEAVMPCSAGFSYVAILEADPFHGRGASVLAEGQFSASPFINFRWLKAPGEYYGRSPVMKALPDIKTANKVVELVLKNASIAVTGIWQIAQRRH